MTTATLERHTTATPHAQKVKTAINAAQAAVERIKNDAPQNFPEAASIGDAVRQGDIYIQLINNVTAAPMLYVRTLQPVFPLQLAEGNSKGSRHCLAHGNGVTVYEPISAGSEEFMAALAAQHPTVAGTPRRELAGKIQQIERHNRNTPKENDHVTIAEATRLVAFAGPILVLTKPNTITHPEHGDWVLPAGSYRITYQRTVARDNTAQRVID